MKYIKCLKAIVKLTFYAAIVIIIEHVVLFSVAFYKASVPWPGECIETFDNFVFFVSPNTNNEVTGWTSEQLFVAEIRTNDLAGQTHKDVLMNNSGPIRIIGRYNHDGRFKDLDIKADLLAFKIQTASDLKIKLKNNGYTKGDKIFPELNSLLSFTSYSSPMISPIAEKGDGFPDYLLFYNDKYIRICDSSYGNRFQFDYDFVYTVDNDNNIEIVRNTCQSYTID